MPARSATSATVNGRSAAATALSTDSALRRLLTADRAEPSASESGPASISGLAISNVRIVDKLAVFWPDYPHSVKPTLRPPLFPPFMKTSTVRLVGLIGLALACTAPAGLAQPASYPSQRITLVVAFAPGGAADAIARQIG